VAECRPWSRRARQRGVAPATSKLLEVTLVVLYIGLVSTALYGGVVPGYRSAAGDAVAERTLATASQRVQQAVPPAGAHVRATARVDLPATIRGRHYRVRVDGRKLVLEHPSPDVAATTWLALPDGVVSVSGSWSSDAAARVLVRGTDSGTVVRLVEGRA
jgi:hypothetical protein